MNEKDGYDVDCMSGNSKLRTKAGHPANETVFSL